MRSGEFEIGSIRHACLGLCTATALCSWPPDSQRHDSLESQRESTVPEFITHLHAVKQAIQECYQDFNQQNTPPLQANALKDKQHFSGVMAGGTAAGTPITFTAGQQRGGAIMAAGDVGRLSQHDGNQFGRRTSPVGDRGQRLWR